MNALKTCNELREVVKAKRIFPLTIVVILYSWSGVLFAADEMAGLSEPLATGRIINVSLGLLFVLAVFFILAFLLKRLPSMQTAKSGCLSIIDTLYLGSNERILLIQVGKEQILVSANAQKIETLHVLPEALDIKPGEQTQSFKQQLSNMLVVKSGKESAN